MSKITYREDTEKVVKVYLDDKLAGVIRRDGDGLWPYQPRGSRATGESFSSIRAVQRSLER